MSGYRGNYQPKKQSGKPNKAKVEFHDLMEPVYVQDGKSNNFWVISKKESLVEGFDKTVFVSISRCYKDDTGAMKYKQTLTIPVRIDNAEKVKLLDAIAQAIEVE